SEEYRSLFGARAAEAVAFYRHQHNHTHLPDGRVKHADGSITEHCHPDDGHHDHDHGHDHGHDHSGAGARASGGGHA
ncbi:MAG: metal ABC transporter ATP-binding protein, partial [Gammaproteobacteria bacterium]|nr:metal ABC transporter ATP-binding protein [Gammaproteobacteria bacterium]